MQQTRRQRTLANLDRINPENNVIDPHCFIPICSGLSGAGFGGIATMSLGQGYGYGAMIGASYGASIPCAYGIGYYGARACRHYQDIRREALARGVLTHHNPLEQAASGASKD